MKDSGTDQPASGDNPYAFSGLVLLVAYAVGCGILLYRFSFLSVLYLATDGVVAAGIILFAAAASHWLMPLLGLGRAALRWQVMASLGIGVGGLSLLVLLLGLAGVLGGGIWIAILIALGAVGLARIVILVVKRSSQPVRWLVSPLHWLWILPLPVLAMSLTAASVPPGYLWSEEARGYDVLEYHLAVPKHYATAGRIEFMPNNVYANFPANAEMLYLLGMVIKEDPIEAAILCKYFNCYLGILFVAAAWLAGREFSPAAGVAAGVVAATTPWMLYLSGIAYAENGMLFFGMMAAAALCAGIRRGASTEANNHLIFLAGIFAGLSCGFKYLAVPMIALPVLAGVIIMSPLRGRRAIVRLGLCLLGMFITFVPWCAKNVKMTGNPVFPLAYSVFGAKPQVWNEHLNQRWERGHQPVEHERSAMARWSRLSERVLRDPRCGAMLFVLAIPILFSPARTRIDWFLLMMFLWQVLVWSSATHLFARFAVPILIPLTILCGRAMMVSEGRFAGTIIGAVVAFGAAINVLHATKLYAEELFVEGGHTNICGRANLFSDGDIPGYEYVGYINKTLPPDTKVLYVGEARTFYVLRRVDYYTVFNENPFAEAAQQAGGDAAAVMTWLRQQRYTHVYVDFAEMNRLRETYGYAKELTTQLFDDLEAIGLQPLQQYRLNPNGPVYAVLYGVPPALASSSDDGLPRSPRNIRTGIRMVGASG